MRHYWIYILTNKSNTLYIGITNDLKRRISEHRKKLIKGFTSRYNLNKLIFYETFNNPKDAIAIEKKIKSWTRKKKIELIKKINPDFRDLSGNI